MRVTYDWTEADWNEAVTLGTEEPRRRGHVPIMVYAVMGIPLFGAVMDGVRSVRGTGKLTGAGMTVPLLLVLLAAALGTGILFARMQRRKRVRMQRPMPAGQWEAALLEAGWSFHAKAVDVLAVPVLAGAAKVTETPAIADVSCAGDVDAATSIARKPAGIAESVAVPVPIAPPDAKADSAALAYAHPVSGSAPEEDNAVAATDNAVAASLPKPPASLSVVETAPAEVVPHAEVRAVKRNASLHPWKELTGSRMGEHVIVLLHRGGFHALPIRCMTPEQASHVHRMVIRKLRPAPTAGVTQR